MISLLDSFFLTFKNRFPPPTAAAVATLMAIELGFWVNFFLLTVLLSK